MSLHCVTIVPLHYTITHFRHATTTTTSTVLARVTPLAVNKVTVLPPRRTLLGTRLTSGVSPRCSGLYSSWSWASNCDMDWGGQHCNAIWYSSSPVDGIVDRRDPKRNRPCSLLAFTYVWVEYNFN